MKAKLQILALVIPISVLLGMTIYNEYLIRSQTEYTFPIEAYDPRDLLAGHYMQFTIKYPIEISCPSKSVASYDAQSYLCLKPEMNFSMGTPDSTCTEWITGNCIYGHFVDGLNRFYVQQDKAAGLEEALRKGKGEVKISVGKGNSIIKDFLIDGKSVRDF